MNSENLLPIFTDDEKAEMQTIINNMQFYKGSSNAVILIADDGPDDQSTTQMSWFRGQTDVFVSNLIHCAVDLALGTGAPAEFIYLLLVSKVEDRISQKLSSS